MQRINEKRKIEKILTQKLDIMSRGVASGSLMNRALLLPSIIWIDI